MKILGIMRFQSDMFHLFFDQACADWIVSADIVVPRCVPLIVFGQTGSNASGSLFRFPFGKTFTPGSTSTSTITLGPLMTTSSYHRVCYCVLRDRRCSGRCVWNCTKKEYQCTHEQYSKQKNVQSTVHMCILSE